MRLMIHLHMRNHNKNEDVRYVKLKKRYGNFGMYLISYLIQVILIAIVSLPLQVLFYSDLSLNINFISILGIIISAVGIFIESLADIQLTKFKNDSSNNGKVIVCPECNNEARVFHFSWSALGCQHCKHIVDKYDWRIATC